MEKPRERSAHVIVGLLPPETLRELYALAQRFRRDEVLRTYVAKRAWFIVPGAFFATFVSVCVTGWLLGFAVEYLPENGGPLVRYTIGLIVALAMLAFPVWVLYGFFSWIEKRALREHNDFG